MSILHLVVWLHFVMAMPWELPDERMPLVYGAVGMLYCRPPIQAIEIAVAIDCRRGNGSQEGVME